MLFFCYETMRLSLKAWIFYLFSLPVGIHAQEGTLLPSHTQQSEIVRIDSGYTLTRVVDGMGRIALPFEYAKPFFTSPDTNLIRPGSITKIELIFTRYPEDFSNWRTDYGWLLEQRIRALARLDSTVITNHQIQWKMTLQTGCKNEPDAKSYFHGFVIWQEPVPGEGVRTLTDSFPEMKPLADIVYGYSPRLEDSSVWLTLERHPEWKSKLVVMDWTSSMYKNGASVINWQRKHLADNGIRHLILFNDGNQTPHHLKKPGKTGGIYHIEPTDLEEVLNLMLTVKKGGLGGDPAENDLEALLKGTKKLSGFEEVILIPDRNSSIRDIKLLGYLDHPVRIILFRNKKTQSVGLGKSSELVESQWIHPHYLTLASKTKGSIHTADQDIYNLHELKPGDKVTFGDFIFMKHTNGSFYKVP